MNEQISIESQDQEIWSNIFLTTQGEDLFAQAYIHGPGRGDEIMKMLTDKLQEIANTRKKKVVHEFTADNIGSERLIGRTPNYVLYGKNKKGKPTYRRTYHPSNI